MGVITASCGTAACGGVPADDIAIRIAQERGIDLRSHISTAATKVELTSADLIVALEPQHLRSISARAMDAGAQMTLLGLWCSSQAPYIPDPYTRADACFRQVFQLIDEAVLNLLERLR